MPENEFPAPLTDLERELRQLAPSAGGLNRDTLFFRAGQASARRGWFWPAATGLCATAAASLALAWWVQPAPEPIVRTNTITVVVHEPAPSPSPTADAAEPPAKQVAEQDAIPPDAPDYLRLRLQVMRWGPDALPARPLGGTEFTGLLQDHDLLGMSTHDLIELQRPSLARPRTEKKTGGAS